MARKLSRPQAETFQAVLLAYGIHEADMKVRLSRKTRVLRGVAMFGSRIAGIPGTFKHVVLIDDRGNLRKECRLVEVKNG